VARSLAIYYGRPWRFPVMDAFYARLVRPGDLCFDLGAHVGNRVRSWRNLGARVVAVEPQPALAGVLRLLYGQDPEVRAVVAAVAEREGVLPLHLNLARRSRRHPKRSSSARRRRRVSGGKYGRGGSPSRRRRSTR
jgi:hypothetical protein